MSKKRTAWTVAIQRGAASHWKLALGCAACAWLVARFIQSRSSSGTDDPAEERRLASERADYFERKAQAVKAARPARRPGSGEGEACPAAPAQPVRAEDLVSPPRYVPPAESAAETSVSRRDVVQVRDGGYEWQGASALFDTGNELSSLMRPRASVLCAYGLRVPASCVLPAAGGHRAACPGSPRTEGGGRVDHESAYGVRVPASGVPYVPRTVRCTPGNESLTVVDAAFARRHGLYAEGGASGVFAQAERWVTLRGVVPGATVTVPVVTAELRVRGHTFRLQVAAPAHPNPNP